MPTHTHTASRDDAARDFLRERLVRLFSAYSPRDRDALRPVAEEAFWEEPALRAVFHRFPGVSLSDAGVLYDRLLAQIGDASHQQIREYTRHARESDVRTRPNPPAENPPPGRRRGSALLPTVSAPIESVIAHVPRLIVTSTFADGTPVGKKYADGWEWARKTLPAFRSRERGATEIEEPARILRAFQRMAKSKERAAGADRFWRGVSQFAAEALGVADQLAAGETPTAGADLLGKPNTPNKNPPAGRRRGSALLPTVSAGLFLAVRAIAHGEDDEATWDWLTAYAEKYDFDTVMQDVETILTQILPKREALKTLRHIEGRLMGIVEVTAEIEREIGERGRPMWSEMSPTRRNEASASAERLAQPRKPPTKGSPMSAKRPNPATAIVPCPECGGKVVKQTKYCLRCKKKVLQ